MIDVRFLTSINVALDDKSLLRHIDVLSDYIADGVLSATATSAMWKFSCCIPNAP